MASTKRMLTALGCLAASMLVATGVLFWLEPDPDDGPGFLKMERLLRQADRAVQHDASSAGDAWQRIEIVAVAGWSPVDAARRGWVGGVPRGAGHHFVVDEHGVLYASAAWKSQRVAGDPAAILIGLSLAGQHVTSIQWLSLRTLLSALTRDHPLLAQELHVAAVGGAGPSGVGAAADVAMSQLAQRLLEAGFSPVLGTGLVVTDPRR